MAEVSLSVKRREATTKGALKSERRNGLVPGVFYMHGNEAIPFSVPEVALKPIVFTSETRIINLKIDDQEPKNSIVKSVQFDPVTDRVIHVDFQGLTKGERIQLRIPVNLVGTAVGVKEGGLMQHYLHKLDVECLPKDIPEHFDVDVSNLNIGDAIHVSDLDFPDVTILNPESATVVGVTTPKAAIALEEAEAAAAEAAEGAEVMDEEPAEPEVIGKGKADDEDKEDEENKE